MHATLSDILADVAANSIEAASATVFVTVVEAVGRITLTVKDNGKGMPADALDSIFNRYYKVEQKSSIPGYGLGLHFVKQVIDKHGWGIHVDSTEGEGSTFTIII